MTENQPPVPVSVPVPVPVRGSMEDADIVLELSRFWFVAAWWTMMLAHASCGAFLIASNLLYAYLGDISLIYYNKLLDSELKAQLAHLGWLFSIAAGVHGLEMLKMVAFSLHARELSFRYQPRSKKKITPALPASVIAVRAAATAGPGTGDTDPGGDGAKPAAVVSTEHKESRRLGRLKRVLAPLVALLHLLSSKIPPRVKVSIRKFVRALLRLRKALYDRRHGYMSVQSKHFHYLFLLRETIEIASQSYQMYNSSLLLARPWINAFFLALVVTNCWSTPILQHALAHSTGLERVMCLVLDGLLDAGSALIIPLIVFIPYARVFDSAALAFPSDYLYDPQWFVNMVRENRMLFAMSYKDLFSKLVPHHSLFSCMKNVKKFIVRKQPLVDSSAAAQRYEPGGAAKPKSESETSKRSSLIKRTLSRGRKRDAPVEYPTRGKRLVHVVFTSWGIAVLAIYLHARQVSIGSDVSACKLALRPWFATSFACASYNFDCYEQGQVETLASADLAILDTESLAALVVSNCPALVMPVELQNFPNLLKFLLYNTSIASWDTAAAFTSTTHTALVSICLVRVNMTEFPLGLQQALPSPLQDVQVSTSNLTSLPMGLAQVWQPITLLYFEHCAFAEFPLVLLELRADELSLAGGTQLTSLPANMSSAAFAWLSLVLSGATSLTALPAAAMKSGLTSLSIENTGVTEIPSWVYSDMATVFGGGLTVYASDTPYCTSASSAASATGSTASGSAGTGSGATSTTGTTGSAGATGGGGMAMATTTVTCTTRDPSGEARYPLALTTSAFQPQP